MEAGYGSVQLHRGAQVPVVEYFQFLQQLTYSFFFRGQGKQGEKSCWHPGEF